MQSLRTRILVSASVMLVLFLGVAGYLLDRAFQDSAMQSVEDRLRGQVFTLIGSADFDARDAQQLVRSVPDPSLSTPGSGHYAAIFSHDAATAWRSQSALGLELPTTAPVVKPGQWTLTAVEAGPGAPLFRLAYGIVWEGEDEQKARAFTIAAYEDQHLYRDTVNRFRRSLWLWFIGISVALVALQAINLNWGLRPLAEVGEEVREIEQARRESITGAYPAEIAQVTRNLNRLLRANRDSLKRYRNALGDLAHSIKTPLAVMRNEIDGLPRDARATTLDEQVVRIDNTVQYYLQRSASGGNAAMAPPLRLRPFVERLVATLQKVYATRDLSIGSTIPPDAEFAIDEGDLAEIIGNLGDNACKWASTMVTIEVEMSGGDTLTIRVSDDGPGFPEDQINILTERGKRLDESVEGQGLGLSIVQDLVENVYGGALSIANATPGAQVTAVLNSGWSRGA